jgi:DNA invertase Pin-like site-specific DNA recombinase
MRELDLASVTQRALRAFIYNRNSRGRDGRSTDDTSLENRRLCEARGWSVAGEFFDRGKSASRHTTKPRPGWDELLAAARGDGRVRGCDVIVYWEASRGYRNSRAYLDLCDLCEETGILLCYSGRVYDMRNRSDRFMTHFDAMRAEDELDGIKERNVRTVRINAERGRPHGRIAYGFSREYDPQTGVLLRQVANEDEAAVLNEAARRVAAGQTLRSIAADFRARAIPTADGGQWEATVLRQLLLRPSNVGLRQFRGEVVGKATWDPIIDEALYFAVTGILRDPGRLNHQESSVKYLMGGIALCGPCGGDPEPVERAVKSRGSRGTYGCEICYRVSMRRDVVDGAVRSAVLAYVERPAFAQSLMSSDGADVAAWLEQARVLEAQLAEARRLAATFEGGRFQLSPLSLAALEGKLLPQIEAARAQAADATVPPVLRQLAGPGARTVWHEELDLEQKRAALRALVKVSLNPPGQGARRPRPEWFTWQWLR